MSEGSLLGQSENIKENESRPVSRRGAAWSPDLKGGRYSESITRMQEKSIGGKPTARPPSAHSLNRKTTSRMQSATNQVPKVGQHALGISNINVLDRPITQQGVSGLRTAGGRGTHFRQVFDKRYYEGLVRMKMKEISTELNRLNGQIELETQQQAATQVYETRVREVASELTKLQGLLADYNVVVDKLNMSTDKSIVDSESDYLKMENERRAVELEKLYEQCHLKEQEIQSLEVEIQNEKDTTYKLIEAMNESDRIKYEKLKSINEELLKEIEQHQHQLEFLTGQKLEFEDKISSSQIKRETVRLYHKLREREDRKTNLLEEERTRSTPAQEREKLLEKVKEDNAEVAAIDRQINQINDDVKKKREELEIIEQDLEESQTDKYEKFKELKKREETLEQFLSTFQESRKNEMTKIDKLEERIVEVLQKMSKRLKGNVKPPGRDEFHVLKETLTMKEDELQRSKLTVEELNIKRQQLSMNIKKVDDLEKRIQHEIISIQEKTTSMNEDLKTYSDINDLKLRTKEKQDVLLIEKSDLNLKRDELRKKKVHLQGENEKLLKHLNENETYVQLNNLEKKLQLLEQNNNASREFIQSKKMEIEYESLKDRAVQSVNEYNRLLITSNAK